MSLDELGDVQAGCTTDVFIRTGKQKRAESLDPACCFSLIGLRRTLDFECKTKKEAEMLMEGFKYLIRLRSSNSLRSSGEAVSTDASEST
jgi:hypothetical protein